MYDNLTASSSDSMFSFSFPYNGYGYDGYVHPQQPAHSQASAQSLSGPQPQELAGLEDLLNPTFQYADPAECNTDFDIHTQSGLNFNTSLGLDYAYGNGFGSVDIGVGGWNDVPAAPAALTMDEATRAWQAQERMLQELVGPLSTGGPCSIDFGFDTELLASESPATIPSRPSSAGSAATSSSSGVSSSSGASSSSRGKKRRRSTAERDTPASSSSSRSPSAFSGDAPSEASSPEDSSPLPKKKHKLSDAPREFTIDTRPLWRKVDPEDPRDIREEPVRDRPIIRDRRVLPEGHVYVSRVRWDSQPPTWAGEVIPKMPIDDVWPYLLAKYRVGKMTQCHMDGCTKNHGKKKGWLKNHILGASHLHVRTLCEKCGYRCRSDNFDERHAKQECDAALPWERQVKPKARRRRAD